MGFLVIIKWLNDLFTPCRYSDTLRIETERFECLDLDGLEAIFYLVTSMSNLIKINPIYSLRNVILLSHMDDDEQYNRNSKLCFTHFGYYHGHMTMQIR